MEINEDIKKSDIVNYSKTEWHNFELNFNSWSAKDFALWLRVKLNAKQIDWNKIIDNINKNYTTFTGKFLTIFNAKELSSIGFNLNESTEILKWLEYLTQYQNPKKNIFECNNCAANKNMTIFTPCGPLYACRNCVNVYNYEFCPECNQKIVHVYDVHT